MSLRDQYLTRIEQARLDGCKVFCLDETWFDSHDTVKKGWTRPDDKDLRLDLPTSRGKRFLILHAGEF